ncbi:omega-amidase, chloroplastic-like isoform X2 [Solanum dulcamara]|uniref:omega-amidase, chloroplastic-like isoform X2 n=1 Tax=Solanum dulcamara TaxID=45834 RepID=UPI00248630A3|nr:omega-amidase, chloroplastic-like isoform X2 [Solanum dulcamara]
MKATGISRLCHLPTTKPSLSFRFCSNSIIHRTSFHNNKTNFPKFLLSATMEASFKPEEARVPAALPLPTTPLTKFKIALCQLSVTTDKERNIAHAQEVIEDAADKGAQLILLPEIWNSPYSNDSFPVYAEDIDAGGDASPSTRMLSEVSRSLKITIIGGSIPERSGDKLYNSCCVFGTDGKLLAKHRKIHLFDIDIPGKMTFKESMTLTAGTRPTIVDTEVGRIGIGICYDIRFQELAAIYAARGAHLLCYPGAFNMTTGPLHWELLQRARDIESNHRVIPSVVKGDCLIAIGARQGDSSSLISFVARRSSNGNTMLYIATCSPARDSGSRYVAWGHYTLVGPFGEVLVKTEHEETTLIAEIDYSVIEQRRTYLPFQKQRRGDLYQLVDVDRLNSTGAN